ncbi:snoal-like polyketide cyclase family [Trichoderma arundinaceum]|uniref:Snoal-like polyketide cyclase family n=1 Tax=Trichoderma arundinaceum TaxID=490622 RepID=A0A395NT82_TRIAR|nr:snoal-like polyketide cyclase family [Trichoderma arundinaceum]
MMFTSLLVASAAALLSIPAAIAAPAADSVKSHICIPGQKATTKDQAINFANFVQELYFEKDVATAFTDHALESYIQHNPLLEQGRTATIAFLGANFPNWNVTVRHQGFDNGIGWVHWKLEGFGTARYNAVVDVFRYEGGCIAEHWDSIQAAPALNETTNPYELI